MIQATGSFGNLSMCGGGSKILVKRAWRSASQAASSSLKESMVMRSFSAARISGPPALVMGSTVLVVFISRLYGGSCLVAMHWQAA